LLKLFPSRLGGIVEAEFHHFLVVDLPNFEVISYRWSPGVHIPILLNGQKFIVIGS
jgi:hypothetical protein